MVRAIAKPNDIVPLVRAHSEQAGSVLARAFQGDPLYAYIFADEGERSRALQALFIAVVKYAHIYGECHTTRDIDGIACWLRPGKTELMFWRILRTGLGLQTSVARFSPDARSRFLGVVRNADEAHKRLMPGPHWYLWALGVGPEMQGQGIGSRLIQPIISRADSAGLPCYLETQTESNVRFYERRGFRVLESGGVLVHGVAFWAMMREPAP